jgi:hypothetical protein
MSTLFDEEDVENFRGSDESDAGDACCGSYGAAGGGAAAGDDVVGDGPPARDDVEEAAHEGGGDGPEDDPKEQEDLAFDRPMANASKIKSAKKIKFATARHRVVGSSDEGGENSVTPQLHCTAVAAEEANDFDNVINDVITTKIVPLGSHDSLHRMCGAATSAEIHNLNFLDRITDNDESGGGAKDLVYDDIEEAINLANTTKNDSEDIDAVDGIEEMIRNAAATNDLRGDDTEAATADTEEISGIANTVPAQLNPFNMKYTERPKATPSEQDTFAPHDILDDIKAAAEMRESFLLSQKEKYLVKQQCDSCQVTPRELFASSSNDGHEARIITPMEPDEEKYDILDAINEVAKGKRSLNTDTNIPGAKLTTRIERFHVAPPSILRTTTRHTTPSPVSPDPPGDCLPGNMTSPRLHVTRLNVVPPSILGDDWTMVSDVFADLEQVGMVMKDDNSSSAYGSTNYSGPTPAGGCGPNIFQQTRAIFSNRVVCRKKYSSGDPDTMDTMAIVSDDEEDNRTDDEEDDDMAIRRPWKGKWDADRYANNNRSTSSGAKSPLCSDGSAYVPESDWDVDDTEAELCLHIEDVFEAKPPSRNKKKKKSPVRIW